MKKQLIALLTLAMSAVATTAPAALINLVSFRSGDPIPPEYWEFHTRVTRGLDFFDSATSFSYTLPGDPTIYPPGWVSKFGELDGGEFFFTDLFEGAPPALAEVSWDFTGSDYLLRYITVDGREADGTTWTNLYRVPFNFRFEDFGTVQVNPSGTGTISQIAFYGNDIFHVPDSGSTVALLGLSVLILGAVRRRIVDASRN